MRDNVIEISDLYRSFGEIKAVDGISFRVRRGELFAFLGVNGAGKSTTINIMCGQLQKDSGSVVIDGKVLDGDLNTIKSKIGVVFQKSVLDSSLSVRDNLESRAALYGICGEDFEKIFGAQQHHRGSGRYITLPSCSSTRFFFWPISPAQKMSRFFSGSTLLPLRAMKPITFHAYLWLLVVSHSASR